VTLRGGVAPTLTARRLGFLDALRGVAVGLVLLQHIGEQLVPAVGALSTTTVQLGQLGVIVFFLCSGFIVPASLERGGDSRRARVRRFWRGRFFRLYPMYWLSLAAALLLALAGRYAPVGVDATSWVVNAGMVQGLVGRPDVIGVYWSLAFELIFYLAVSLLFLLGLHRRSVLLSLAASGVCVAAGAASWLTGRPVPLGLFCVVTMFAGTVLHRWHTGAVRLPAVAACLAGALGAGTVLLAGTVLGHDDPTALGTRSFVPMLVAWAGAYGVVGLGLLLRNRPFPRALVRLGVLSYAVYLLHPLVLAAVPRVGGPLPTALVWAGLTLLVSAGCHRFVERPAIRLGRRVPRRPEPARPAAVEPAVPRLAA
jgi:peptidoglycan/LPS O-acetylase OafA/YrhL